MGPATPLFPHQQSNPSRHQPNRVSPAARQCHPVTSNPVAPITRAMSCRQGTELICISVRQGKGFSPKGEGR